MTNKNRASLNVAGIVILLAGIWIGSNNFPSFVVIGIGSACSLILHLAMITDDD